MVFIQPLFPALWRAAKATSKGSVRRLGARSWASWAQFFTFGFGRPDAGQLRKPPVIRCCCGEGTCSRSSAQHSPKRPVLPIFWGCFAAQREQARSPQCSVRRQVYTEWQSCIQTRQDLRSMARFLWHALHFFEVGDGLLFAEIGR